MKTKIEVNVNDIIERTKQFGKEYEELCNKYGLVPEIATNEETKDVFFIVSVKDLINEKDIKMNIEK